ncbi:MAG: DGQHR domain-containing protein DpdB [Candidatus Xenobiia bacterium LiM19]
MSKKNSLTFPALEIKQGKEKTIYSFAVDGKLISQFAAVSRIRRSAGDSILGYQRPEVRYHINEIRDYLESDDPLMPNVIVIAFDERVRFEPSENGSSSLPYVRKGTFVIPYDLDLEEDKKPGWIVDGQQRVAALREAKIDSFPVSVNAFISKDIKDQREQFILVNSTKPLPKGLLYELLPVTDMKLPTFLEKRKLPAYIAHRLNTEENSPLRELIQTPTNPAGVIKDNSILKMIENSLTDGVLYRLRDPRSGDADIEGMLEILKAFWNAVAKVFPDSWGVSPKHSRLLHGAGIASLGFLMDAISDKYRREGLPTQKHFENDLKPLKDICRWNDGYWDFGPGSQRKWNEIQNTSKDIKLLANYLLVQYKLRVWNKNLTSI